MTAERLQKLLARAGVASRRTAERYITDGRVRVNGKVEKTLGAKADPDTDVIEVEGYGRLEARPLVWVALHKPEKVVTTLSDPEGRRTVADLLLAPAAKGERSGGGELPRVFPVGRLDYDAEGLVLLTNDGELANRLLHPRYHVPKTYVVKVEGRPEPRALERLRHGVYLKDETGERSRRPTRPALVRVTKVSPVNTWMEITIVEGRHHQVKLMCQAIGHPVIRIIRTHFGGISLDGLDAGAWRYLSRAEVDLLRGRGAAEPTPRHPARRRRPSRRRAETSGRSEPRKAARMGH
jgi:pseudouridine synthase